MGMRLEGRTALITGAAGGIGSATALAYAREGADLCLSDYADTGSIAAEVEKLGRRVVEVDADVTDRDQVHAMVATALDAFGRIDILATIAGVQSLGGAENLDEAEWDRVIDINLKGTWLCCQAVIPAMREQKYGRIITIGSNVVAIGGNSRPWLDRDEQLGSANVAYGSSKAGVHAITLYLAKELAADGITVNSVAPGPVATAMVKKVRPGVLASIPVGRLGKPEEIADAALYLAGELTGYMTGGILDINGGRNIA